VPKTYLEAAVEIAQKVVHPQALEKLYLCALIPSLRRAYNFLMFRTLAFRGNEEAFCACQRRN
jgi:hypothetical protein